jgi:hypothetical protein
MNEKTSTDKAKAVTKTTEQKQLDFLAVYDRTDIGCEFKRRESAPTPPSSQTNSQRWHVNQIQANSQAPLKERFESVRRFEENTMHMRGKIFWAAFILISCLVLWAMRML